MLAAARERPRAAHPVAAVDHDGLSKVRARRHHGARIAEHGVRDLRFQIGGRDRAAAGLADAPGRAGVGLGDLLDGLQIDGRLDLRAATRAR